MARMVDRPRMRPDVSKPPRRSRSRVITKPLEPNILRAVALGMADGQLCQADALLTYPPLGRNHNGPRDTNLERALKHMRSACGWLTTAANHT